MWKGKETVPIDKDTPLEPGTRVLLHFRSTGGTYLTAIQIAVLEKRLENRQDWRIRSHSLPANNQVIFEVEVLKHNPVLITCSAIAGVIIAAGVVAWLLLEKTERIVDRITGTPAGQVLSIGGTAIIGALVIYLIFKK